MKKYIFFALTIVLTGFFTYIFTPRPYQAHHHANFAVYIDGEMQDFSSEMYMEETSRCNISTDVRAQDRIHLHDQK
jgi:protocatechuate 3,4-dioxygenase beta subunit